MPRMTPASSISGDIGLDWTTSSSGSEPPDNPRPTTGPDLLLIPGLGLVRVRVSCQQECRRSAVHERDEVAAGAGRRQRSVSKTWLYGSSGDKAGRTCSPRERRSTEDAPIVWDFGKLKLFNWGSVGEGYCCGKLATTSLAVPPAWWRGRCRHLVTGHSRNSSGTGTGPICARRTQISLGQPVEGRGQRGGGWGSPGWPDARGTSAVASCGMPQLLGRWCPKNEMGPGEGVRCGGEVGLCRISNPIL